MSPFGDRRRLIVEAGSTCNVRNCRQQDMPLEAERESDCALGRLADGRLAASVPSNLCRPVAAADLGANYSILI
jgi:hypothetical protein